MIMTTVYDFFLSSILPLFVDTSKFAYGEHIFYYMFVTAISLVIVGFFIILPYRILRRWLDKFTGKRGSKW